MILTRTPLRVSLFGGGTDYPSWFTEHGGATLGMAINKYVYVGVKHMSPGQLGWDGQPIRYRVQYSHVDDCCDPNDIKHPAVRAAIQHLELDDLSLEFHIFSDLPGRSGLGGSSSCTVGILHALDLLIVTDLHREYGGFRGINTATDRELANYAIGLEQDVIGETVGCQDQIFAALGGVRTLEFRTDESWEAAPLFLSHERQLELESSLLLVMTGIMRDAHEMAARQVTEQRLNQGAVVANVSCTPKFALHLMAQQAQQATALLSDEEQSLEQLGPLLHEAWMLKRGLADGVTLPEVDELYAHGLKCGATGGKLLGAGGGGFFLFFVPKKNQDTFRRRIGRPVTEIKIEHRGSHVLVNEEE